MKKIATLIMIFSLNLSAGIFDELMESLNIAKKEKEVTVENSTITSTTEEKEDTNKEKKDKVILVGEKISITNSDIKVDNKEIKKRENLGKIIVVGQDIAIENSEIEAKAEHHINDNNRIIGHNGSVYINGEKVEVENSNIRASSIGSGNEVVGTSGSVVLGSH